MDLYRPLWHMGPLHPVEQFLTLFLAFGPFVVLGIVIWRRSKADAAEEAAEQAAASAVGEAGSEAPEDVSRTAQQAD